MNTSYEVKNLDKITHSIRANQLIYQFGVGAMINFPDQVLMCAAPEYWETDVTQIHDKRLENRLGVEYFGLPIGSVKILSQIHFIRQ